MTAYFEMFPMQVIARPVKRASASTLCTNDWICLSAHLSRLSFKLTLWSCFIIIDLILEKL